MRQSTTTIQNNLTNCRVKAEMSFIDSLYDEAFQHGVERGSFEERCKQRNLPNLIGITGHYGAGKDATAALLAMLGYKRYAFADAVRSEVYGSHQAGLLRATAQGANASDLVISSVGKLNLRDIFAKPTSDYTRVILQWWGTDYRRSQDVSYWTKQFDTWFKALPKDSLVVVSDVRFDNEVKCIRHHNGLIWKIQRDLYLGDDHASELAIDGIAPDCQLQNNGTLYDLVTKVNEALVKSHDLD